MSAQALLGDSGFIDEKTGWPKGTVARGSTESAPESKDSFAIDGNANTYWQDATEGSFPDTLTISLGTCEGDSMLTGISVLSSLSGWITDYKVYVETIGQWQLQVAEVANIKGNLSSARFNPPVPCKEISTFQIEVESSSGSSGNKYSRIAGIAPKFGDGEGSNSSVTAASATASTSVPSQTEASSNVVTVSTSSNTSATPAPSSTTNSKSSPIPSDLRHPAPQPIRKLLAQSLVVSVL